VNGGALKLTRDLCIRQKKPFIVLDATQIFGAEHITVPQEPFHTSGS
jgi:hypothetical protein